METIQRFFPLPSSSFFLFGPRGTGKSTWLRTYAPKAIWLDLLDPETYRTYLSNPERLRELIDAAPDSERVIIDEVQKVPQLLDVVHQLIEEKHRPLQFILTGSSARKLKRTGIDLLAGRALLKTFHPFMAAELGDRFDLGQALRLGMLPLVLDSKDPEETLKAYISLYLREEVQAEGLVRNVGGFSRFLETISLSHGAQINLSNIARECHVGRKTAEGFLNILEDLLLGFRIRPFTKRARRQMVQHPKFYYMDTGVFRSLRPKGPLDTPEMVGGTCLEGLVAQHLRAWIAYSKSDCELYFWRTKSGLEVDFILYGQDTFLAIEVKKSRSVFSTDIRPLAEFKKDYPEAQVCLLYGGSERLKIKDVPCLPCETFLRHLIPNVQPTEILDTLPGLV
ncbi:MAG: ATP-binding protein [Phycisphaerales bacterium]|nr:ATP-binding protein [Phycisphaerales bacterium]